jgi:ribose-phosphate pyrophosphokinase
MEEADRASLDNYKFTTFPAGERNLVVPADLEQPDILTAIIRNSDNVMDLLLLSEFYRSRTQSEMLPIALNMPYVPYARQDRATTSESAFSLRAFARLINMMKWYAVLMYEPHSDVTPALFDRAVVKYCDNAVVEYIKTLNIPVMLLAPDAGAEKRTARVHAACLKAGVNVHPEIGQALKHRNPATGRLEISFVSSNIANQNVIVVDDICDGGATFKQLADYEITYNAHSNSTPLKQYVQSLHLFVAHGIFSKGMEPLADYQTICTTNSFYHGQYGDRVKWLLV